MKFILALILTLFFVTNSNSQTTKWTVRLDSASVFSSPRFVDINNDDTLDVIYGGGNEGYYIENGKIQYPVKAATLISTGPAVLKEISMVGKDFSLACGMCGSVSGAVPTSVGQATLKVDEILVGGQA